MKFFEIMRFVCLIFFIGYGAIIFASCSVQKPARSQEARPLVTPAIVTQRPKIVAFGDSLTAGFGLTEIESYPYLLQQQLIVDGYNYEVINAGVSGDTSLGGAERIDWVLGQEDVQILIIELGANDLLRGMPVQHLRQNLEKIIQRAKAKNVTVLLCGMLAPPTVGAQYQREFTAAFPELAAKHKIAYLPFVLENIALQKQLNQADGIHPNVEGAKIMTANIYKELRPMLQNK